MLQANAAPVSLGHAIWRLADLFRFWTDDQRSGPMVGPIADLDLTHSAMGTVLGAWPLSISVRQFRAASCWTNRHPQSATCCHDHGNIRPVPGRCDRPPFAVSGGWYLRVWRTADFHWSAENHCRMVRGQGTGFAMGVYIGPAIGACSRLA